MSLPHTAHLPHDDLPTPPAAGRFSLKGRLGPYCIALLAVGIATGLDVALWGTIRPQASPLYIAAVMVTAWFGGLGPGILATALAGIASVYLFVDPVYSFRIPPPDLLRLVIFLAVALLISWLNARRKHAEQSVEAARASLERKVADRTNDLEIINVELRAQQQQLRELSWQLSQTQEQERRRIATALHDGLAQLLAVAAIKIDAIEKTPADGDQTISEVRSLLEEALTQTRSLTIDLSPPVLYELGLKAAIEWLAQEMAQRYRLKVEVVCGPLPNIDEVTRSVLFHSIRELLINVAKHAHASCATVTVSCDGAARVNVSVEDDGRGFDSRDALTHAGEQGGFGLFNVRERIHHLAGSFRVCPRERQGTCVQLTVPVSGL